MDPIVRYGKHFGRTISAVTDIAALITNGLNCMVNIEDGALSLKISLLSELFEVH